MVGEIEILKKNRLGGFASVNFAIMAVILIISASIDYENNDIYENKSILPLDILQNKVNQFYGNITIKITFSDYGGRCSCETDENPMVSFSNLAYSRYSVEMEKSDNEQNFFRIKRM